jgi:hypothetical protein
MDYEKYIQSKHWAAKRSLRLKIDDNKCQGCGKQESLHVHHKTYVRLGNEDAENDLITLCELCHDFVHKMHKQWTLSLAEATNNALKLLKISEDTVFSTTVENKSVGGKDNGWLSNNDRRRKDTKLSRKLNGL